MESTRSRQISARSEPPPVTAWTVDVVIATRDRPDSLRECLTTLNNQSVLPNSVFVIDSSDNARTAETVASLERDLRYHCFYHHSAVASAAQQRNIGAQLCSSRLILLLDDDVVLEADFVAEVIRVFEEQPDDGLGGVSGTISNQVYSDPRGLNRALLGLCIGQFRGSYAGRVIGPAVNFLPADGPVSWQQVQWLPTTCTAYRRDVFMAHGFEQSFAGYSFAEDVHISTRIAAANWRLINTTKARVFHADLGKDTHRNWIALGESQVQNRHLIMTSVLRRNRFTDHLRLFAYEMVYAPIAWLAAGAGDGRIPKLALLLLGKLKGFWSIWKTRK